MKSANHERRVASTAEEDNNDDDDDDDGYQYLSYLRRINKYRPLDYNKRLFKINRLLIVIFGAYVCNSDIMAGCESFESFGPGLSLPPPPTTTKLDRGNTHALSKSCEHAHDGPRATSNGLWRNFDISTWLSKPLEKSKWRRELNFGWISRVILATFFLSTIILLYDVAYLYKHDISCLRLKRVQDLILIHGPQKALIFESSDLYIGRQAVSLSEYEQVLKRQIEETRHVLSYLGDRFIVWGVLNECMYLYALALCLVLFLIPMWLFTWMQRLDIPFHRDLLDHLDEVRRVDASCENEVLKYLESNRVHAVVRAKLNRLTAPELWRTSEILPLPQRNKQRLDRWHAGLLNAEASDSRVCCMLMQMLTSGALRPIDRSSLWIERQNRALLSYSILTLIYFSPFPVIGYFVLYERFPTSIDLGELSFLLLLSLVGCAILYFVINFFVFCVTQLELVNHNLHIIQDCIRRNERQVGLYKEVIRIGSEGKQRYDDRTSASVIDKINSNFLFALMTYKIFVKHWLPYRAMLRGVFLIAFLPAFIVPVLVRTHVPYLVAHDNRDGARKVRVAGLIISLVILGPVNSMCLPMCHLHARCQKLYKALASLMAHITEVGKWHTSESGDCKGTIYNRHAVRALIKEISQPKQMLEQFVVNTLGLGASFSTLVRLHFWWGFLALSMLVVDTQGSDQCVSLFSFMADPLNVWNFHV